MQSYDVTAARLGVALKRACQWQFMQAIPSALYSTKERRCGMEDYSRIASSLKKYIMRRQSLTPFGAPLVALSPFLELNAMTPAELCGLLHELRKNGEILQAAPCHYAVVST